ncbi:Alpha/Beta hydrolase protein [Pyronema domesticum]|nr:Alpha/Beta hydrolase protein [Pyronema domesticum]
MLSTTAASPEVINSLVDQLSKLQPSPLHNPFLYGSLAPVPAEPEPIPDTVIADYLHPDDAAMAPVVRTSKPPSGYSSHTKNDSLHCHSRRSSLHSGLGVNGNIPDYVRTYMNRPPEHERRPSRDSAVSVGNASTSRLSYNSSRERVRNERERRHRDKDRASTGMGMGDFLQRSSSLGKGDRSPKQEREPEPNAQTGKTLYNSPIGSPVFTSTSLTEEEDGGGPAPAPNLPSYREPIPSAKTSKRRSKGYPKRSDSLPSRNKRRHSSDQYVGVTGIHQPTSPIRPSFQEAERPSSADSVDDAVDAYLCSPRLTQKIRMPTSGRTVSFSEVGDPQGFAVFVCVGMGLTRYVTAFYDELALTLGLRLITPDRPGVGESDPVDETEQAVLNWPDDVLYICQALKITKFSILAHSAGAIYALATALRMPGHIRGKIHLLAPWIPPSQMESVVSTGDNKEKAGSIPTSQRILRALPTPILKAANSSFISNPEPSEPSEPTPEQVEASLMLAAIAAAQEKERQTSYDERLTSAIWSLSTRNANPAVDLLVCLERNRQVGFRYVDIVREVVIHHGVRDTRVPVENVKWLGKTMRRCEVRILPTEGHGLMASAMVMGGVLEEIANEWKDWRKVVEGRQVEGGGRERRWAD